jgi:hypothetical protein
MILAKKYILRFSLNIILIISLVFLSNCNNADDESNFKEKIEKVKIGMAKNEVLKILGSPSKILKCEVQDSQCVRLIYEPISNLSSTIPYIDLSSTTERVLHIVKEE